MGWRCRGGGGAGWRPAYVEVLRHVGFSRLASGTVLCGIPCVLHVEGIGLQVESEGHCAFFFVVDCAVRREALFLVTIKRCPRSTFCLERVLDSDRSW